MLPFRAVHVFLVLIGIRFHGSLGIITIAIAMYAEDTRIECILPTVVVLASPLLIYHLSLWRYSRRTLALQTVLVLSRSLNHDL